MHVDLTERIGASMESMLESGRAEQKARRAMGFDQAALDQAARRGFAAGAFEESEEEEEEEEEEGGLIVEEFAFADDESRDEPTVVHAPVKRTLREKLSARAALQENMGQ